MKAAITAGLAGILFSLGLGLGGMTDPQKVVGFLDVAGTWDPSLMFVMMGALGAHFTTRRLLLRRKRPLFAESFPDLPRGRITGRLVAGSALFGIGWGLGGYCPGPGITSVGAGGTSAVLFVVSMLGGMALHLVWNKASSSTPVALPVTAEQSRAS